MYKINNFKSRQKIKDNKWVAYRNRWGYNNHCKWHIQYNNEKYRQLQSTWNKNTFQSQKRPKTLFGFPAPALVGHLMAETQNSLIHPHIWCLEFLYATNGWTDKESNRLQHLSAASRLLSVHLISKAFVVNSSFKHFDFRVMPFNISITFYSFSQGRDIPWGKMDCYAPVDIIMVFILFWLILILVMILYSDYYLDETKIKTKRILSPFVLV